MQIIPAQPHHLAGFFRYLDDHLSDNGVDGTSVFQPLSRKESKLSPGFKQRFERALGIPYGQSGWRKLWLAFDETGEIAGHIDIRPHPDANTSHRALLGMGVERSHRQQGLGSQLLETLISFATTQTQLAWLDLWVLTTNKPARGLYEKSGFVQRGELEDMFRIDGVSYGYTLMSRRIKRSLSGTKAWA